MSHEKKRRRSRRQAIIFIITLVVAWVGIYYLWNWYEEKNLLRLTFEGAGKQSSEFKMQIAETPRKRELGLMYVKEMKADHGMVFIFPQVEKQVFWMRNTYIPLDMLFLDEHSVVLGVLHDVPILNDDARKVDGLSKYVVELNAGAAKREGIEKGWKAVWHGQLPEPR